VRPRLSRRAPVWPLIKRNRDNPPPPVDVAEPQRQHLAARMRCTPAAAAASAHHPRDHGVTPKPGLRNGAGMGAAIVRGHDLDVLVPTPAIATLVLDAGIGKVHVTVVVPQLVLPRPPRDLFRFPIRPPAAVRLATVALEGYCRELPGSNPLFLRGWSQVVGRNPVATAVFSTG
jgi:hypothetical protein